MPPREKKMLYPEFQILKHMLSHDEPEIISHTLNQMSFNKFPKDLKYRSGMIFYKSGGVMKKYEIKNNEQRILPTLICILYEILKLKQKSFEYNTSSRSTRKSKTESNSFQILEPPAKRFLLDQYALAHYPDKQSLFKDSVRCGIMIKTLNNENIIIEDGRIKEITNIFYNDKRKTFTYKI